MRLYTDIPVSSWLKFVLILSLAANVLGGMFVIYKLATRRAPRPPTYAKHRDSLFAELSVAPSPIVMIGGSLNDWAEWAELLDNPEVINRGVSGATSADVKRRLATLVEAQSVKPAQIIMMVGFNDLDQGGTVADVVANHRAILTMVRENSPDTEVIVQSILPANTTLYRGQVQNRDIRSLNQKLAALCREYACRFLNVHDLVADEQQALDLRNTYDGVHLNGRGYRIWRAALLPLVRAP